MRNLLALLAAFTLSTSTAITAVACGTSSQTTTTAFNWNRVINGENGKTAEDFFNTLLDNPSGIGQSLYKNIVDYISLSILKTNSTFSEDYQFAKISVENQIKNIQDSLRAKYGRSWESQWKDFLKQPAQGGNGQTGSYQRYFDILLKDKANTIVSQYYVGDNYHNYQYYSATEIGIWLNDIYKEIKLGHYAKVKDYRDNGGLYGSRVWIVVQSFKNNTDDPSYDALDEAINQSGTVNDITLEYKVAKTKDDQPKNDGDDYLIDPSNTIKGLLSDQQAKIAQVWMKNQGPIWARQIVIPFNTESKKLDQSIDVSSFSQAAPKLQKILLGIKNNGFEYTLKDVMNNIGSASSSSENGDLGLVTLNSDTSKIKTSFSYYLYRYVTSAQGIGKSSPTTPTDLFDLPKYVVDNTEDPKEINLTNFIKNIDRTLTTPDSNNPQPRSKYHDLVWMEDGDQTKDWYSGTENGTSRNNVAIFIDEDGIHFVQTPGITYSSIESEDPIQKIITDYNQKLISSNEIKWEDIQKVTNRKGGLVNNPYLNFLQTQYLYWNARNETPFFDLNNSLTQFTSGSTDISSDIWWDYILYFNNNIDNIHWNISEVLNTEVNASTDKIVPFVRAMQTWFIQTNENRWNLHQGILNTDTLSENITKLNATWNAYENGETVVINTKNIIEYLKNVAEQTIWWYDSSSIKG